MIRFITIERLRRDRIYVRADGEFLRFRAPLGVLTESRLDWLKRHKPELLARLAAQGPTESPEGSL